MHKTKISLLATLVSLVAGCSSDDKPNVGNTPNSAPCSIEENDDATVTIECPDGSSVTVNQGSEGQDGRDGKDGETGKSGKTGAEGQDGTNGENGDHGQDGATGQNGDQGQDGATGQNGENGHDGTNGENGDHGQDGAQGDAGLEGTPGGNGQNGDQGQPGEAGASCSVECVDEQTVRMFCEDGNEVSYQVDSCKTPPVNLLSARGQHGCWVLPGDRRLVCWGSDSEGQLGNGVIEGDLDRANLVDTRQLDFALNTRWRSIETGSSTSCGITTSGKAYCWGSAPALGNGGLSSDIPSAVDVSALPPGTTWLVISPGSTSAGSLSSNFSCGVTALGAAYCWGSHSNGSLGNGPGVSGDQGSPSPVDISSLAPDTTWSTIDAGNGYACGLTAEGTAYCWGSDSGGKLGNGPSLTAAQSSPSPVDVSALPPETTWTAISVGFAHTCALTVDGEAYCWGSDANGQLGNGALGAATSPSLIDTSALPEGVTFTQLSAGEQHTCAIASNGSAWCWGNRTLGRLGEGNSVGNAQSPVAVNVSALPIETTWKSLSAGAQSSCGLTTDDEVYCWGDSSHGQLGAGPAFGLPQLKPGPTVPAWAGVLIDHREFSGAVGIDNPQLPLTVLPLNGSTEQLIVTATSLNEAILPSANITVTGTGSERLLSFEPVASGPIIFITVSVATSEGEYSFRFEYGASAEPNDPAGVYYYQMSNTSTAIDVGDGYMLLGDDDANVVFLYKQDGSGFPLKVWDFTSDSQLGSTELAIESAARSGDTIVWAASHGNNSRHGQENTNGAGATQERRRVMFATTISGSGANTELSFAGRYGGGPGSKSDVADLGLWADLITWDKANGHGMGADALGFEAATQDGVFPFAPSGFSIEGMEFAANGTTGYLGFRAPTINVSGSQHALIVPVTNVLHLVDGIGAQSGQGQFGAPILLDLGGRSIREMRRNASGEYVISAGPPLSAVPGVNDTWALYTWAGLGQPAMFNRELPDTDLLTGGPWESIASVPNPLQSRGSVRLVTDSGNTVYYGYEDGGDVELGHQKCYGQLFTLQ